jgi:hypothetical protein
MLQKLSNSPIPTSAFLMNFLNYLNFLLSTRKTAEKESLIYKKGDIKGNSYNSDNSYHLSLCCKGFMLLTPKVNS